MDKAVKRHILKKRIVLAKRSDEPMTFTERAPRFFKWFEEDVMGFDSDEYRREFWREAYKHGRTIGHVPHTLSDQLCRRGRRSEIVLFDALCISFLMGGAFAIWVIRRRIDQHLHRLRRPSYYETERARRLGLTEERRRIRSRTTVNSRPTAEQLREAFIHARDSVSNMVRLGSLMEDLECYIDNSLVFGEDGKIIARKGGIRRYIQSEIPDLYKSYKTLMRYKALARRFRQAVGISDPTPAASVLPEEEAEPDAHECHDRKADDVIVGMSNKSKNTSVDAQKNIRNTQSVGMETVENMVRTNSHGGEDGRAESGRNRTKGRRNEDGGGGEGGIWNRGDECMAIGCKKVESIGRKEEVVRSEEGVIGCRDGEISSKKTEVKRENGNSERLNNEVKRVVGEILNVCEGTFLNLSAVLALRIGEDTIPHRSYQFIRCEDCA